MDFDLDAIHRAAVEIAEAGGKHTLDYFGTDVAITYKEDDSPVTAADRECEALMREKIAKRFPDHGILGEEFGRTNPDSPVQWVLDPIDGTRSFIHGIPLYTTLVGVLVEGEAAAGVIYAPAAGELCHAARGKGAQLNGRRCRVRSCTDLSEATFLSTDATTPAEAGFGAPFEELLSASGLHRTWGDAYGHMMVATGRADLMFDPVLNPWDAAPLGIILSEAGGVFSDVSGRESIASGHGFSCGRPLKAPVLEIFNRYQRGK